MNRNKYKRLKKQWKAEQLIVSIVAQRLQDVKPDLRVVLNNVQQHHRNIHYKLAIWIIENAATGEKDTYDRATGLYSFEPARAFNNQEELFLSRLKQTYQASLGGRIITRRQWDHLIREGHKLQVPIGSTMSLSTMAAKSLIPEDKLMAKLTELLQKL